MLLMSTILLCTPLAALWPSMPGPPKFTGPHHVQIEYNGWDLTDFVFNCTILYKKVTADDGARFDVALSFDDVVDEATVKTTTSLHKTVVFNSADLQGHFGTEVGKNWCTFNVPKRYHTKAIIMYLSPPRRLRIRLCLFVC